MAYANVYFQVEDQLYTTTVLGKAITVRKTGGVHKDNPNRVEVQVLSKNPKEQRLMYILEKNLIEVTK